MKAKASLSLATALLLGGWNCKTDTGTRQVGRLEALEESVREQSKLKGTRP